MITPPAEQECGMLLTICSHAACTDREGRGKGVQEGLDFGVRKGFEVGSELGFYAGCLQVQLKLDNYLLNRCRQLS